MFFVHVGKHCKNGNSDNTCLIPVLISNESECHSVVLTKLWHVVYGALMLASRLPFCSNIPLKLTTAYFVNSVRDFLLTCGGNADLLIALKTCFSYCHKVNRAYMFVL